MRVSVTGASFERLRKDRCRDLALLLACSFCMCGTAKAVDSAASDKKADDSVFSIGDPTRSTGTPADNAPVVTAETKFDPGQLFQPFMRDLQRRIKSQWRPPSGKESRRVVVVFKINRFTGQIYDAKIAESSGDSKMDAAALASANDTAGLIPLFYLAEDLPIQFTYDYNVFSNHKLVPRSTSSGTSAAQASTAKVNALSTSPAADISQSTVLAIAIAEQEQLRAKYSVSKREAVARAYDKAALDLEKSDVPEAKKYFYKAAAMNPSDSAALQHLDAFMRKDGLDPKKGADHATLGDKEFEKQHFRNAFVEYSRAYQLDNTPENCFHMVRALAWLPEQDKIEKWRSAAEKSKAAASYVAYGSSLAKVGDFDGAETQYKDALAKDPQSASAQTMMKLLPEERSKWEQLQDARKKLFFTYADQVVKDVKAHGSMTSITGTGSSTNRDVRMMNNEGVKLMMAGQYAESAKVLKNALAKDPGYSIARSNLAIAYNNYGLQLKGDPKLALYFFERASYLDPTNQTTLKNLSGMVKLLGKEPDNFEARVELADGALLVNDLVGERAELMEALKLKNDAVVRARILDTDRELSKKDPHKTLIGLEDQEKEKMAEQVALKLNHQSSSSASATSSSGSVGSSSKVSTDRETGEVMNKTSSSPFASINQMGGRGEDSSGSSVSRHGRTKTSDSSASEETPTMDDK